MKTIYYIGIDKNKIASIDLVVYSKGMLITRIFVPPEYQDQGYDEQVLKLVLDDADAEGVILYLTANAHSALTTKQLRVWYRRHGFIRTHGMFIRRPFYKG
ncbi:MAG: GNAT family N-acetyltransferase [Gammaproteobacteria bacterium]|nr:GNAT family N-acetyltransferase [Gammaproteobacteria bacterium]